VICSKNNSKHKHKSRTYVAWVAIAIASGAIMGTTRSTWAQQPEPVSDDSYANRGVEVRDTTLRGIVLRHKDVRLKNRDRRHRLVLLRTEDGFRRTLDLGPADKIGSLHLQDGDDLAARGPVVMVGDRQVLMANQIRVEGQTIRVERDARTKALTRQALRRAGLRGQQQRRSQEPSERGTRRASRDAARSSSAELNRQLPAREPVRPEVMQDDWLSEYYDWHREWDFDPQTNRWQYESVFE
jgi:hypothetical protein